MQVGKAILTILSKVSYVLFTFLIIYFILFNSDVFSSNSGQAVSLTTTIQYLSGLALVSLFFAGLYNPEGLKRELANSTGPWSLATYLIFFFVFGFLFISFEGRFDPTFITGVLLEGSFLYAYTYIVASLEEIIFRIGILEVLETKSPNRAAVYIVGAAIFSLYHYFKYDGSIGLLIFAFFAGLGFVWIKEKGKLGAFPSFPASVSLHQVFNLWVTGGLSIVFLTLGVI